MKYKIFFLPISLFLFIFLIDKISIIPGIHELGRIENSPLENIADGVRRIYASKKLDKEKTIYNKKTAIILGTSRSDILKFSSSDFIRDSKFISFDEKKMLLHYDVETRSVVKASDFLYNYFLFKNIKDSGFKPEIVLIEVSPETTNLNSPFHVSSQYSTNIIPYKLLLNLVTIAEKSWFKQVLTSAIFPSSYYKFKPEKAISNFFTNKDYLTNNNVIAAYEFFPSTTPLPTSYEDYRSDNFPPEKYQERILDYSNFLKQDNILRDYSISKSELALLDLLLKEIHESNLNVIFWRPKVHNYYYTMQLDSGLGKIDEIIETKIRNAGYPYINLQLTKMNCDYFTDASHHSGRCAPEILNKVLSAVH
ncbi:MAG: DUF1574 domain-containing protein [Leptospiraceae bacterium]|nr:DUF1574 domain-containing protein [Leptospiraceae bacterium]